MRFWRGEAYTAFTKFLDSTGGFYYEVQPLPSKKIAQTKPIFQRWGDAPVHSMAVALFAKKEQIHFFDEIGYSHAPFTHCPQNTAFRKDHCDCRVWGNFGKLFVPVICQTKLELACRLPRVLMLSEMERAVVRVVFGRS